MKSFKSTLASLNPASPMLASFLRARLAVSLSALVLAAGAAGCDPVGDLDLGNPFCSNPVDVPNVRCSAAGTARVSSPAGFALPAMAEAVMANSCMSTDGSCTSLPHVFFQSPHRADDHGVNFGFNLQPTDGPGTYPLAGDAASAHFYGALSNDNLDSYYYSGLRVVSGTLVVTRNDEAAFRATFDLQVETEDGLHRFALAGGRVDVSDCDVVIVSTCYDH